MTATQGPRDGTTSDVMLLVTGMSCRHCVRQVTACVRDVPGVETVEADRVTGQVRLRGRFALRDVLSALARAGNEARVVDSGVVATSGGAAPTPPTPPSLEEDER